jgi:hypothetical protein
MRQEPHHWSVPRAGWRPHRAAAAGLKKVIWPSASVVKSGAGQACMNSRRAGGGKRTGQSVILALASDEISGG